MSLKDLTTRGFWIPPLIQSRRSQRLITVCKNLSMVLFSLSGVVAIALYLTVPENVVMVSWTAALTALLGVSLLFVAWEKPAMNQFMLSSGLPVLLVAATVHSKLVNADIIHDGSYYNPRYFLIGMSFLPLLVFDLRQKKQMFVSIGLNLTLLICYIPIHRLFGAGPEQIMGHSLSNSTFVTVASSAAGLAITFALLFLKRDNFHYETQVETLLDEAQQSNEEINAGIRYARRLQQQVIPGLDPSVYAPLEVMSFERPKDTLSGDFFFHLTHQDQLYFSVADCTGHGVSGAFVSLMAHRSLSQAIQLEGRKDPSAILQSANNSIIQAFQEGTEKDVRDGMDLCLVNVDTQRNQLHYASARGISFLLRDDELITLQNERKSIGEEKDASFECFTIDYQKGDLLIMTSDGFIDQFGGGNDKKFSKRRFRSLCEDLKNLPVSTIQSRLHHHFDFWKGECEQTDDVCVAVIRL